MATDPAEAFRVLVEQADALAGQRRWQQCGDTWVRAARVAVEARAMPSARQSFEAAGEAYRRDDRPTDARRALESALTLPSTAEEGAVTLARLAGVLAEIGEGRLALVRSDEALTRGQGSVRNLVLDTAIGVRQGFGRKAELRPLVDELDAVEGADGIARWFRRGQLHRLDGELDAAATCFERVHTRLAHQDGAEAGVAAAEMELADLRMLQGDPGPAIDAFERGRVLHEVSGRRAYRYRCEAGRVRAAVQGEAHVWTTLLDEALAFGERRGMVLLTIDVRIARGMALASRDVVRAGNDLARAEADAERVGARLRSGRAALQWALLVAPSGSMRTGALERAATALTDDVPLRDRALAALRGSG